MGREGGGGGGGGGGISAKAMGEIRKHEKEIQNSKVENYFYIDRETGEVLDSGKGTAGKVMVDSTIMRQNPGHVFTHNHPGKYDAPLSASDARSLVSGLGRGSKKAEVRAITRSGTVYRARITKPVAHVGNAIAGINSGWGNMVELTDQRSGRWVTVKGWGIDIPGLQYRIDK